MKLPLALAALRLADAAQAQTFPTRPVTVVVPFPPSGGTDTGARIAAQKLGTLWDAPVQFAQLMFKERNRHAQINAERKISID